MNIDVNAMLTFQDPREVPAYSIVEAAHYLRMPKTTIRAWVCGTHYTAGDGSRKKFQPIIQLPQRDFALLSFFNLAEAHVLRSLRTAHRIRLQHIRAALKYVKQEFGWNRPLIEQKFQTDGARLFVERVGKLIDASAGGQLAMREVLEAHLQRLEWEDQIVARLYPFTRDRDLASPKSVMIDPRYSFGRPILHDSRVATAIISERYKAGDSVDELAKDYGCSRLEIEEGLRCELNFQAA